MTTRKELDTNLSGQIDGGLIVRVSTTAPTTPEAGDLWFDTDEPSTSAASGASAARIWFGA